ncbi:MAG: right-handed parallel beta-helix repeat-containing protein [Anaerolineae bacterium]|nr:right-handed parallel beta-helix repeat-containing protein [Anaerolineae bacterium]
MLASVSTPAVPAAGNISVSSPTSGIRTTVGQTYYVRPDGGNAEQCTGLADAPYPGSGAGQPCAWDHPFRALQPSGEYGQPGFVRISGGDTLIIAPGSYRIGYGAPGAEHCQPDYPWDCLMPPPPGGPDAAHPTRILGKGWDAGCLNPPELWGTERVARILDLSGVHHVEIACLEITDHATCAYEHTGGLACDVASFPYGDWASVGLYAVDAANVTLRDLNIHGLAERGVLAGRLRDWTVERVRIAGNGWAGWDGDVEGHDSNSGTLTFRHWTVEWNGCVETYPGEEPTGCWAQTAGGYGDGVGTGESGGHWIIEDSTFLHNTSDGLDLLYTRVPGSRIEIRRALARGNAGNQIKTNGPTVIENSILVGNCGYFEGKPFTHHVDNCRAAGNALSLNLQPGNAVTITNNTLTSEGDCLVEVGCEGSCTGTESVRMRNNIFLGQTDFLQPSEQTCLVYWERFPADPVDMDYGMIYNVKENPCPVGGHDICQAPGLVNETLAAFDAHLRESSPAINAGSAADAPPDDFDGRSRDAHPDIGAYEYWKATASVYLPLVARH